MEPEVINPTDFFTEFNKSRLPSDEVPYQFDGGMGQLNNYDTGLTPYISKEENRAENQSAFQSLRNSVSQLITGTIGELVATPGYATSAFEPIEEMDKGLSGLFIEAGEAIKNAGQDFAPLYQGQASGDKIFAPWDSEWMSQTIADFGPTIALVGATLATEGLATPRLLAMLSKVPGIGKYAKVANALKGESALYKNLRTVNSTLLSRNAENGMEAHQTFDEVYNKLRTENPELSDKEMRKMAGEAASQVWNKNWSLTALDFIQYHGLLNGFGKFGKLTGFVGSQVLPEAFEEGLQYAFQKEAKEDIDFKLGKIDEDKNTLDTFIAGLSDKEMQKAMVQGGLGASVFFGAGKIMEKLSSKYRQPITTSVPETIHEAATKGDLVTLKQDVENQISQVSSQEQKSYLEGIKKSIEKYEQVLATLDSPYKSEIAKLYTQADQYAQQVEGFNTQLDKVKGDTTLPNASMAVGFAESGLAIKAIDKLRTKNSKNPLAQKVLDRIEEKYKQQEIDTTIPSISSDSAKVVPLIKPIIVKKIEQEFLAEITLQLGSEVAEGKLDNFQEQIRKIQQDKVKESVDIEELNQLQEQEENTELKKEAKKRLNELYKAEDKNVPTDINLLPEYYKNNPVTFLRDKRDLYNLPDTTTLEEFTTISTTPEFQEQFNKKVENKVVEEKLESKKKEVEEEVDSESIIDKDVNKSFLTLNQEKAINLFNILIKDGKLGYNDKIVSDEDMNILVGFLLNTNEAPYKNYKETFTALVKNDYTASINSNGLGKGYTFYNTKETGEGGFLTDLKRKVKDIQDKQLQIENIKDFSNAIDIVEPEQDKVELVENTDIFVTSQEQEHQTEAISDITKEWQDVNANKLRTADAVTYSYDDGIFTIPLLGKRLTEEQFANLYSKANKSKGYHVLYDKNDNVVFHQEGLIDTDLIRNLYNRLGEGLYTTPVTLHINGNYVNGNFKNKTQGHQTIQIEAKIGNSVIGKLPSSDKIVPEQRQQFDSLRKQIFEAWQNSGKDEFEYPVSTNIDKILPGRFWQGIRTTDINSLSPDRIILGLAKNGQLVIPNVGEDIMSDKLKEELQNKFNLTDGNVYWLIKSPITGQYIPYRLFTKKVKDVGKEDKLKEILVNTNKDNVVSKRKEIQEIIRWKDKEGKIQPDFFYTKEGKLIAKLDGFTQEFQEPVELFDAYDMSDRTLQVDEQNLNSKNFNDVLIKQGYFEATLNPGLFHSPSFTINLDKLYADTSGKLSKITRGKPKFSLKTNKIEYPVWNQEEETKWFKERLGEVVDLNVASEEEMDSLIESLKHIHGQDNLKAWGFFHNAATWISQNAKKGTTQHEAFHVIFNLALSKSQQEALLNEGSRKYNIPRGTATDKEILFSLATNEKEAQIEYALKITDALNKIQRNKFDKSKLQGWLNDLSKQGVPKQQLEIFQEYAKDGMTKEEIIASISADLSFVVESGITKKQIKAVLNPGEFGDDEIDNFFAEEFSTDSGSTTYYSNLTVAGGTNYTENEIRTPNIVPSIKGHAQFSTNEGIGWFRADVQTIGSRLKTDDESELPPSHGFEAESIGGEATKIRRILELQSDLFQKGRDKTELTAITKADSDSPFDFGSVPNKEGIIKNKFLQLLNKDNTWVTFFIKSIVQDSQKKGYEKVLFPKGETAAKIEGHDTLANEINKINNEIEAITNSQIIKEEKIIYDEDGNTTFNYVWKYTANGKNYSLPYVTKEQIELDKTQQLVNLEKKKQELKSQGIEKLKPVEGFYEVKVGNVLKKNYKVKEVVDEYGNGWWEVDMTTLPKETILLSTASKEYYSQLSGDLQIEERLADDFAEYVQLAQVSEEQLKKTSFFKQLGSRLQRVFRKMYLAIKASIGLNLSQEEIFFRIQKKSYKNFIPIREGSNQFKPSVRAYVNPIKQKDRINFVNWEFITRFNKFKKDKLKENPDLTERELTKKAVDITSPDNLFKKLSDVFREEAEVVLLDTDYSIEQRQYFSTEYIEMANKLWNKDTGYGLLYENVLQDLKRYGIRVKMLKEDVEVQEDEDTKEMWMEVNTSPFDSFTQQLKQGLGLLIETNFTGLMEKDEWEVPTGFKEVDYVYDDLGHQRSIDVDNAYNTLMEEAHGSLNVDDMMSKIKNMADNYPWAKQLYEVLSGRIESSVITNPDHFKTQLYYTGLQSPAPVPKYLLEMWTTPEPGQRSKKLWILSNSTIRGLTDRLKKEWLSNLDNPSFNKTLNNPDRVKDALSRIKAKKNDFILLHNVLNGVGITIPKDAVEKIVVAKTNLQDLTETLFTNISRVDTKEQGVVNSVIESIANLAKKYYKEYHQSSHTNVEGETINNYIRNSFMARQINKFKRGQTSFYRPDPFYEQNNNTKDGLTDTDKDLWLDRFETDARKKLEFAVLDGTKYSNGQSTVFQDMSPIEFIGLTLNSFYNNGNGLPKGGNKYIGKAFYSAQLMADSGSHALIGFESYTNEVILDKLVEVALREYNAILEHKRNPIDVRGYEPRFTLIPGLTEQDFSPLNVERLKTKIKKNLDKVVDNQIDEYTKMQFFVDGKSDYLDSRIGDIKDFMTTFVYNDYFAQTQIISLFHGKLFMYKSMEDFYKRAKEIWSPGNFLNDKQVGINKEFFSIFVESQIFDYSNNKEVIDTIMSNMRKIGIDEQIVLTTGAKYGYTDGTMIGSKPGVTLSDKTVVQSGSTDATDAQGIIDIHRWREISLGKGIDPVEVERIYNAIISDTYTITDLSMVLNPFKQFYYQLNHVSTEKGTVVVPLQIKNSECVLIPQVAKGNPELELILQKLEDVRRETGLNGSINFNSAVKVGERNTFDSIDSINADGAIKLLNEEYRIQGEVPEHQVDTENRLGTQLRKLIMGDLENEGMYEVDGIEFTGKEIKEMWNELLMADVLEASKELETTFKNPIEFYKMLQNEAMSRDYPDKFIEALILVDGKPRVPLYSPLLSKKSVPLIASIYRNRITTLKFPGASLPNVMSYGLKEEPKIVYNEDGSIKHLEAYMPLTHKWLASYMNKEGVLDTSLLAKHGLDLGVAYRIPTENKYSMVPIKIIGFTNAGIVLPKEITTIAGLDFDIDKMYVMLYSFDVVDGKPVKTEWQENPTYEEYEKRILKSKEAKQYLKNNNINIEDFIGDNNTGRLLSEVGGITESFFDQGYTVEDLLENELEKGGIILTEYEWNKLNVYEKNSKGARNNRKLDIIRSVLTNKNTMQAQIVPGGFAELEAEAKRIAVIQGQDKKNINPMNLSSRLEIFKRMMAGKKLIGIPANYNSTHALMQGSGMELVKPVLFNGLSGKNLGLKYVMNSKATVTSDIAQFLASVVDNGKNPLANLYNLNTYTADVAMLITKFFGKEVAMRFIAQPVIREFYTRYVNLGATSKAETEVAIDMLGMSKKDYFNMLKEEDSNIDDSQLEAGLRDKVNSPEQKEILKQFLKYKKNQAKDLGKLVGAIKVPDNGMRSTLERTITGIDRLREAKVLETITNIDKFFNDRLANNVMYEEGITKGMNKFVKLGFPDYQGTTAYTKIRDYFTEQKGSNLDERELTLLHDTSMSYLSSGFETLNSIDRLETIRETPKLLKQFKASNPIAYSKFVNSLEVDKSEKDEEYETIKLASGLSKVAENDVINQWEQLLSSPIQEEKVLGNMLLKYAFISNGFRFSPGSLSHIQPISSYENMKDSMNRTFHEFIGQQIQSANQDENFLEAFKVQFIRHYFPRLSFIKSYDLETAFIRYDEKTKEPYGVGLDEFANSLVNGDMPEYIKVQEKVDKKKQWYLFKNEIGTSDYYRINSLGMYREFEEWDYGIQKMNSDFKVNNMNKDIVDKYLNTKVVEPKVNISIRYYEGNIKPELNTIFVFGSNPEGRHGAGAAKIAKEQFGAIYGQGEGLQGNSYALPTKDLRITKDKGFKSISFDQIVDNIRRLYDVATQNPTKQFKIAYRNTTDTSLNGYTGLEMIEMFNEAGIIPSNIVFSKEWFDTNKLNIVESTANVEESSSFDKNNQDEPKAVQENRIKKEYPLSITIGQNNEYEITTESLREFANVKYDSKKLFQSSSLTKYNKEIQIAYGDAAYNYVVETNSELSIPEGELLRDNKDANIFIAAFLTDDLADGKSFDEYAQLYLDKNVKLIDTFQLNLFEDFKNNFNTTDC